MGRNPVDGTIGAITRVGELTENVVIPFEECSWRSKLGPAMDSLSSPTPAILKAARRDAIGCEPSQQRPRLVLLDWVVTDTSIVVTAMRVALNGGAMEEYVIQRQGPLYTVISRRQYSFSHRQ